MTAIETAVLKISLDRDTGVPEHLQSLKSSVVALAESVAGQQVRLGGIQSRSRRVGTRSD